MNQPHWVQIFPPLPEGQENRVVFPAVRQIAPFDLRQLVSLVQSCGQDIHEFALFEQPDRVRVFLLRVALDAHSKLAFFVVDGQDGEEFAIYSLPKALKFFNDRLLARQRGRLTVRIKAHECVSLEVRRILRYLGRYLFAPVGVVA